MADLHVTPIADIREHEESRACWCEPLILDPSEGLGDGTGDLVIVHNSADCREFVEAHGLQ